MSLRRSVDPQQSESGLSLLQGCLLYTSDAADE